ncbi:MRG-binding protein [Exophiala aquamarina CBS 119918]|uniref:MRG-binding protein n=1 Tax=Exophiala aquamarina CBS 119918 TaxID=1182545 RepID=A0A072PGF8_9EURO|nr:MRG-binding protein [Exophiala aquamarina CBS 119918]KEF58373.1 MRG-binding protein [Exophiala aquamarina CBS 119918]
MAKGDSVEMTDSALDLSRWTDDQESALLEAIIRWKPVGMHKHFRMIAIRDFMINQGVTNTEDPHTTTAGIWAKLESLYYLAKLDEREDSIIDGIDDDDTKGAAYFRDFELPREDFEELMWQRRLAPEGTQSPDVSRRESTVADTDEPRSSPVSGRGSVRGTRGSGRRGGRLSRLQNELESEKTSSRRSSKATSVADEDQVMEDADEDDEEGQDSGDEGEESSEPEEEESRAKKAARGGRRGRARRGRKR